MTPENVIYFTKLYASKIGKNPEVKFKRGIKYHGKCWKDRQLIVYNQDTLDKLTLGDTDNLIIHEVCHLKYNDHSKRFKNLCRKMGITDEYWIYGCAPDRLKPAYLR